VEIYSPVEPWVLVGIFQINCLAGVKTGPGQARSRGDSNYFSLHSHGHCGPEFIGTGIIEEETATVSVHHLGSFLCDLDKQSVDLQIKADELTEFEQGLEFAVSIAQEMAATLIVGPAECPPAVPLASFLRKGYFRVDIFSGHGPRLSWDDCRFEKDRFEKDLKAILFYSIILKSQQKKGDEPLEYNT